MRRGTMSLLTATGALMLAASATVSAAVVSYLGAEVQNYQGSTWEQGNRVGWRTAGAGYAKAYDADGNNIYGSDGYVVYAQSATLTTGTFPGNDPRQLANPTSYIDSVNVPATAGRVDNAGSGFGNLDSPAGGSVNVGCLIKNFEGYDANAVSDFLDISINKAATFTIGLETLNGDNQKPAAWILGGVTASRAQTDPNNLRFYGNPDWYFFSVTTAGPETITLQIQRDGTGQQEALNVMTFDSPVPEPASLGILGVSALGLLCRRK